MLERLALLCFLALYEAEDGDKDTEACNCAKCIDDDVARIAVAARNEALVVFVEGREDGGNNKRDEDWLPVWELFRLETAEEINERCAEGRVDDEVGDFAHDAIAEAELGRKG